MTRRRSYLGAPLLGLLAGVAPFAAAAGVGWRGDWSGAFSSPQPPTAWSQTEHVAWKARLPGASNGSPVAVGSRVFVCAEPTWLLCFDRHDGKLLWKVEHNYDKVLPPDELAAAERDLAAAAQIRKQVDALHKQLDENHRGLKDAPDDAALIARRNELRSQIDRAKDELKPLERYRIPDRAAGCTTPTPASDGQHVFVLFGTGIAACYDLDGKPVWIRLLERPEVEWGQTASPLLVGKYLLAQTKQLVALDTESGARRGRPRWRLAPVRPCRPGSAEWTWSSRPPQMWSGYRTARCSAKKSRPASTVLRRSSWAMWRISFRHRPGPFGWASTASRRQPRRCGS